MSIPKMGIKETRADLEREVAFYLAHDGQVNLWRFINVYGAARELKGHVDSCERREHDNKQHFPSRKCGDDWYCDKAETIRAQGKLRL